MPNELLHEVLSLEVPQKGERVASFRDLSKQGEKHLSIEVSKSFLFSVPQSCPRGEAVMPAMPSLTASKVQSSQKRSYSGDEQLTLYLSLPSQSGLEIGHQMRTIRVEDVQTREDGSKEVKEGFGS